MIDDLVKTVRAAYATDDFIPLHAPIFGGNETDYVTDTIASTFVSSVGAYVDRFESEMAAYTGAGGDQGKAYEVLEQRDDTLRLVTTQALPAYHGLTVAVDWPAGLVARPGVMQRLGSVLLDNLGLCLGALCRNARPFELLLIGTVYVCLQGATVFAVGTHPLATLTTHAIGLLPAWLLLSWAWPRLARR